MCERARIDGFTRYSSYFIRSTTLPVFGNAPLLSPPTTNRKWPVLVFSHGLGGSRNTYTQICGSLASHGAIVAAPEHRDGSGPITLIGDKDGNQTRLPFQRIPYKMTPENFDARATQLRIRLWELGAVHDLLLKLNSGKTLSNFSTEDDKSDVAATLTSFKSKLNVQDPGSITWGGHSFGAASIIQFIKSTYYEAPPSALTQGFKPLYRPVRDSPLVKQITPSSPVVILDLWSFPLLDPKAARLNEQPLPAYQAPRPDGSTILAVLSEAFFKWNQNLIATKEAIRPPSSAPKGTKLPYLFFAEKSAHLSQSDFGVLFPWVTRVFLKTQDPVRIMKLNTRAILEVLRKAGIEVGETSDVDMEVPGAKSGVRKGKQGEKGSTEAFEDRDILSGEEGRIKGWVRLDLEKETHEGEGEDKGADESAKPVDRELDGDV